MGIYTKFWLDCELKENVSQEVIDTIHWLLGEIRRDALARLKTPFDSSVYGAFAVEYYPFRDGLCSTL